MKTKQSAKHHTKPVLFASIQSRILFYKKPSTRNKLNEYAEVKAINESLLAYLRELEVCNTS